LLKKRLAKADSTPNLRPLSVEFYSRNTVEVAQDLLGKVLAVRLHHEGLHLRANTDLILGRILETEAYRGDDPASHAFRGVTPRSAIMFGRPGIAYVYKIYGVHQMLNFVTEPEGEPGAVLIRALDPLSKQIEPGSMQGPGRLCRSLGIQMTHSGESLQGPTLMVMDDGFVPDSISCSERVGINVGQEMQWRFFMTDHVGVSRAPQNAASFKLKFRKRG
jgi:DNA-3-methyladenine glycosylase